MKVLLAIMSLYVHDDLISVKTPNHRAKRVCVVGLADKAILLSCLGALSSGLCGLMSPPLQYSVYKHLKNKLKNHDGIVAIPYSSIQKVKAMVKYGIEVLIIETRDGAYEFTAVGRYAKFGIHKLLMELKSRLTINNPTVKFEENL